MSKKENQEIILKIISIGNSGVGKTSIIKRFVYKTYEPDKSSTVGLNFAFKDIILKNGIKVKLKIIDTAGEEKFRSLSKSFFKNAEGVFFVFGMDDLNSFTDINEWIKIFNNNNSESNIPKFLLGNKSDLNEKIITDELIEDFLKNNEEFIYKKVSAAINENIDEAFQEIAEKMFQNYKQGEQNLIKLEEEDENKIIQKRKKCICLLDHLH